jgi:arylsulfatase A-like enzyme
VTGRYQQQFGHEFNPEPQSRLGLPRSERTLADALKAHAYTVHIWPPEPNDESPAQPAPQLPPQYNARSELTATVDRGDNVVNFELASRSPVVQPISIR